MNFSPLAFWSTDFEIVYYSIAAATSTDASDAADDAFWRRLHTRLWVIPMLYILFLLYAIFNPQHLYKRTKKIVSILLLMNEMDDEFDYLFLLQLEPQKFVIKIELFANLFQLVRNYTLVIRISWALNSQMPRQHQK